MDVERPRDLAGCQYALDTTHPTPPRAAFDDLDLEPAACVRDDQGVGCREPADLARPAGQEAPAISATAVRQPHGWAGLRRAATVTVRPRGHSLTGKVNDGDQVTVEPLGERDPEVGDIVLARCRGHDYLHLVKARCYLTWRLLCAAQVV